MRNLIYKLADGTVVNTYNEAKESGQSYTVILKDIDRAKAILSDKRKAMLVRLP